MEQQDDGDAPQDQPDDDAAETGHDVSGARPDVLHAHEDPVGVIAEVFDQERDRKHFQNDHFGNIGSLFRQQAAQRAEDQAQRQGVQHADVQESRLRQDGQQDLEQSENGSEQQTGKRTEPFFGGRVLRLMRPDFARRFARRRFFLLRFYRPLRLFQNVLDRSARAAGRLALVTGFRLRPFRAPLLHRLLQFFFTHSVVVVIPGRHN